MTFVTATAVHRRGTMTSVGEQVRVQSGAAFRLAQFVAIVVSIGFSFGGFIGIADSDRPGWRKGVAVACLVALLVLHLYNCVRRSDGHRPTGWQWTLAAQAVLTGVGMIWFATTWYGNSGFLAAALLLLIRRQPLAWTGFCLVVVLQFFSGLSVRPTVWDALYLAVGHAAFVGITLYGVARMADLVADLHNTRDDLAAAEVAKERLAFAEQLHDRIGTSLRQVARSAEAISDSVEPESARERLDTGLQTARAALNEARSVAHGYHGAGPAQRRPVADDLTVTAVAVLGAATICLMILPAPIREVVKADVSATEVAAFLVALLAFVLLYLRNCTIGADNGRPRWWQWTLAGQVVLAIVPSLFFGLDLWYAGIFLPGLTLALLRGWPQWAVTLPLIAQDAIFFLGWGFTLQGPRLVDQIYEMVWIGERAIVVYGLVRMGRMASELRAARLDLARTEIARERLRFARDLHDLLGLSLSIIVLKCELAFRLFGKDIDRGRRELAEGLRAARQALADIDAVATGHRALSLQAETQSAREALSAAGFAVTGTVSLPELGAEASTVLATVIREGVTNVLRHSDGDSCTLEGEAADNTARLKLSNNGARLNPVPAAVATGMGTDSLRERVRAIGGTLNARLLGDTYVLTVEVPSERGLQPALVGGDADGVDPVPGVELHDRRG